MESRAYQEEGAELTPAMRDALAVGQVDTFGDRRGEVQAAMRDVGYGGSNWT